jgi:predicted MFS family arabinose efflux permease
MFSVPLYFKVTARASNTASGAHLIPAVFGNALGGVISGVIIKRYVITNTFPSSSKLLTYPRSGRYKSLIILAVSLSSFSYLLLMFRWHGNTNIWESLYIFPSGFGTGIAQSAVFISLQAVVDAAHMAPAISFMYLSSAIAVTIGMPVSNAVMQTALRWSLNTRLPALGLGSEEIRKVTLRIMNKISNLSDIWLTGIQYVDYRKLGIRRRLCRPHYRQRS